jgi:hypothetical protein
MDFWKISYEDVQWILPAIDKAQLWAFLMALVCLWFFNNSSIVQGRAIPVSWSLEFLICQHSATSLSKLEDHFLLVSF